jgi:hypothetical protein
MTDWQIYVAVPVTGWALVKLIQHEKRIAVIEQIASDIRDSLKELAHELRNRM